MSNKIPAQDSRGNFKRDLGWEHDGKQHRFYLGRDKAIAQRRSESLERLWELVEARWEAMCQRQAVLEEKWNREGEPDIDTLKRRKADSESLLAGPRWDSVTLAIGDAIRKGEPVCVLNPADHGKKIVDWGKGEFVWQSTSPDAQLEWLRDLQNAFPIITLKLADDEKYKHALDRAAKGASNNYLQVF